MSSTPSDLSRLAFGKYVGGVLPGTPAMLVARFSDESFQYSPTIVDSPELDPTGQPRDTMLTGAVSEGAVNFPLARSLWFDEMLAAVFRNSWGTGQKAPGTGVGAALTANELVPGAIVQQFDIQKKFLTPTAVYHRTVKTGVASLNLRLQANEIISGTVQLMGGVLSVGTTDISGATYADPGTYPPFTAPNVTNVNIGSFATAHCFQSLNIGFNSNLRNINCIGAVAPTDQNLGRFMPSIEGQVMFIGNDVIDELLSQTYFAVSFTLSDGAGNSYTFDYPRCKILSAPVNIPGTNQDVVVPISLKAHYDPMYLYACKVTRVQAP